MIPRVKFWIFVKEHKELQDLRDYYRNKLSESMESQQYMMNGEKGRFVFTCKNYSLFVRSKKTASLIDFNITNEDIAGFCGISPETVSIAFSNELKREGVLDIRQQKDRDFDNERIEEFIGRELF